MNVRQLKRLLEFVDDDVIVMDIFNSTDLGTVEYSPIGLLYHEDANTLYLGGHNWDGKSFGDATALLPTYTIRDLNLSAQVKAVEWYVNEWDIGDECDNINDVLYSLENARFEFDRNGNYIER